MWLRRHFLGSIFAKLFLGFSLALFTTAVCVWAVTYTSQIRESRSVGTIEWHFVGDKAIQTALSILKFTGRDGLVSWLNDERLNSRPTVFLVNQSGQTLTGRAIPESTLKSLQDVRDGKVPTDEKLGVRPHEGPDTEEIRLHTIELDSQSWDVIAVRMKPFPIHLIPPELHRFPIGLTVAVALLLVLALSWALARFYTRNINRLDAAMAKFAAGDFNSRAGRSMTMASDDEISRLARGFDSMADRLQGFISQQQRLFHSVSHEIRSPLARIEVALELAKMHPDRSQEYLERIQKEVGNIDSLVGALLTYARLDAIEKIPMNDIALRDLVAEAAGDLSFEGQKKHVTVRAELSGDPTVRGSAPLLAQALQNVTRNALRYAPEGSEILLTLTTSADHCDFCCRDQGPGMDPKDIALMFNPFVRGSHEPTGTGFGLGMAITHRAVTRFHGTIEARNVKPHGLEIHISLPLAGSASAPKDDQASSLSTSA